MFSFNFAAISQILADAALLVSLWFIQEKCSQELILPLYDFLKIQIPVTILNKWKLAGNKTSSNKLVYIKTSIVLNFYKLKKNIYIFYKLCC